MLIQQSFLHWVYEANPTQGSPEAPATSENCHVSILGICFRWRPEKSMTQPASFKQRVLAKSPGKDGPCFTFTPVVNFYIN